MGSEVDNVIHSTDTIAFGFQFDNETNRLQEFKLAQEYFKRHPTVIKIRRSEWQNILEQMYSKHDSYPIPKHSYLRHADNSVVAIASGKARLLGQGGFGRVKLAMDIHASIYALKIEEANPRKQETEALKQIGLLHGEKIARKHAGKSKRKTKYYTQLRYLGDSISTRMKKEPALSLDEKLKIARKIAWEIHKLHTGKLAKGHRLMHGDIKPDNIMINHKGKISLTDFGFAGPMEGDDWNPSFQGTPMFLPCSKAEYETLESRQKPSKERRDVWADVLSRMKWLGQMGTDTLALKRTLYYEDINLLSASEFAQLPSNLQALIKNEDDGDYLERTKTPFDIAYALLQFQMERTHQRQFPADLDDKQKESIYNCVALLDEINENQDIDDTLGPDELAKYQRRLLDADPNGHLEIEQELQELHRQSQVLSEMSIKIQKIALDFDLPAFDELKKKLLSKMNEYQAVIKASSGEASVLLRQMQQCIELLDTISRQAIDGKKDTEMSVYLHEAIKRLLISTDLTNDSLSQFKEQLHRDLRCAQSKEMSDVLKRVHTLEYSHFKWHATDKAAQIKHALQQVPVQLRETVFSNESEATIQTVRLALANKREWCVIKKATEDDIINGRYAHSFRALKLLHQHNIKQQSECADERLHAVHATLLQ